MMSESENDWYDKNISPGIADAVVRLRVQFGKAGSVQRDFRPDVNINYDNLEHQLEEMPSIFSFWSSVLSEQRAETALIDRVITAKRAQIAREIIEKSEGISKWKIDEIVEADEDLNKFMGKLIISKRKESKLYGIVDALKMKSDNLRSLAGFKRQELTDARGKQLQ